MNYPLISEYVEAIKTAEDNFDQLKHLRPVLDDDGLPVMTSGNFAVVFKMKDEQSGKFYAVKCFTKEQEGRAEAYNLITEVLPKVDSPYILSINYLEKELFVDTTQTDEAEFPVLLMYWVEGKTLDKYIRENIEDQYSLEMLAYRFSQLAQWLIPQPFAHGDLKPDNILVREDGTLVLVDYDGMYVPAMKGQKARELGSPDFRHPSRTEVDFDEHIDDFALLILTLTILIACESPSSFSYPILTEKDFQYLNTSQSLKQIYPSCNAAINKTVSALVNSIIDNEMILPITIYDSIAKHVRLEYYNYAQNYYDLLKDLYVDQYAFYERFHRKGGFDRDSKLYPVSLAATVDEFNEYDYDHNYCNGILLKAWDCEISSYLGDTYEDFWLEMALPSDTIVISKEAFSDCACVELIVVPKSVKFIGDKAFYNCESLRYIVFPESIEGFGTDIFSLKDSYVNSITGNTDTQHYGKGAHSLVNIIVPDGTKEYYANLLPDYRHLIVDFSEFVNNLDPTINPLVLEIAKKTNVRNDKLIRYEGEEEVVEIPCGTKCICDKAFYGKKDLKKVVLPETIERYGCDIFENCENLETIILPSNIKHITNRFLSGCKKLNTVHIPNSVTSIGISAFSYCEELTALVIPENVNKIGDYAFYGCKSLKEIVIPNTVTKFGENVFEGCESICIYIPAGKGWKFEDLLPQYKDKLIEQNGTEVTERDLANSWVDPFGVRYSSDGRRLLKGVYDICSYSIIRGTKIIGNDAFANRGYIGNLYNGTIELVSDTLTDINIPNTVVQIGEDAFSGCKLLKEIIIPNSVRTIGNSAFKNCLSIIKAVLSDSLTQISNGVFYGCESLRHVYISDSVLSIDDYAFHYCLSLTSINIPNSVKYIGHNAFSSCHSLTTIKIPDSVTSIGSFAFYDCVLLKEIFIPTSITQIEECTFRGCISLSNIYIPHSVVKIGYGAFDYCFNLRSIVVDNNNSIYDSRGNCNAVIKTADNELVRGCQNTIIPNNVIKIGDSAFCGCRGLTSIIIPNSVTTIDSRAFYDCTLLTEVILPNSIIHIKDDVFQKCNNLTSIIIPNGSKSKFKKILPSYRNKLKEVKNSFHKEKTSIVKNFFHLK